MATLCFSLQETQKTLIDMTAHAYKRRPFIDDSLINELLISFAEIFCVDFDLSNFPAQNGKADVEIVFFKIYPLVFALISYSLLIIVFCAHWGMRKINDKSVA